MELNQLAQPKPILDEVTLASIRPGSLVKIQITDGISDKFNETIIMRVKNRDEHVLECEFVERQLRDRFADKSHQYKTPFQLDTVLFIKEAVFAVENE